MSTIKVDSIKSSDGNTDLLTLSNGSVSGVNLGRRNLIINGAMQVAQRGTSVTGVTTGGYYTCDRFGFYVTTQGTHTVTQETDAPDGFANSFKMECTTADASPAASDLIVLQHRIEGQDLQHLKKGTASALPVTISFWVKSSKTGTHLFELYDADNTRHIQAEYTITAAGTWEKISITLDGDTTGALDNDNAGSLYTNWWLGAGTNFTSGTLQTSWASAVSANRAVGTPNYASAIGQYFQITGVQLEVGSVATPFEHRSYGEELALCQRYYFETGEVGTSNEWFPGVATYAGYGNVAAQSMDGNQDRAHGTTRFPVTMRATPTVTFYPGRPGVTNTAGNITVYNGDTSVTTTYKPVGSCGGLSGYFQGTSTDSPAYTFQFTADAEL